MTDVLFPPRILEPNTDNFPTLEKLTKSWSCDFFKRFKSSTAFFEPKYCKGLFTPSFLPQIRLLKISFGKKLWSQKTKGFQACRVRPRHAKSQVPS